MLINPEVTLVKATVYDTPCIKVNDSNLDNYDIKPVNDYVFIFDVDYTLYKASEEMMRVEIEKWKSSMIFIYHKEIDVLYHFLDV